ncbi:uncharacterized protein LOC115036695 isoform X1 [Echeneis naucrates]|uniref:uncharacterized protein LOC115036695 isoform X1 n=1 Tax=Echeneis naucrates TaxID=173247 RepID=UPI001113CFE5|nr:uncharacterized protein LOC115036695 isoform X1 [Echeneis naucrates]
MATAGNSDDESLSESSGSVYSYESSDGDLDVEDDCQVVVEPCKYYNKNRCRDGDKCAYMHVCKYALKGNCKYGSSCKLNHPRAGRESSRATSRASERSVSKGPRLTDGRYYQWQLNDGNSWMDVANDHVIEGQYCLPHTKSIKLFNTSYGAVSIEFNRMRVSGKRLRVRRLDDGNTVWTWYCTLRHKWIKYGDKDSKGNCSPMKSSDIEQKFQRDPSGCFSFTVGAETVEIKFKEMQQVSKKKKRKVTRRPEYRQQQAGANISELTSSVQNISLGSIPQWQFEGSSGKWHSFKRRQAGTSTECSVTSDDIERKYQENSHGSMMFKVNGDSYRLDFRAMMQTNLRTKHTRKIKRVLV